MPKSEEMGQRSKTWYEVVAGAVHALFVRVRRIVWTGHGGPWRLRSLWTMKNAASLRGSARKTATHKTRLRPTSARSAIRGEYFPGEGAPGGMEASGWSPASS